MPDFTSAGDGPRLTLEALVHEAFDAYPGRASLRKVRAYVEANRNGSNWSDVAIVDWYGREKKRRQRARQDAREAEKARQLRWSVLVRKSQNLASQAAAMLRRGDPRGPIWERRAGIYAAEEARREAAGEAPSERLKPKRKPRGYTSAESDAWLAAKGAQVRAPWDDQGVTGGVCPP